MTNHEKDSMNTMKSLYIRLKGLVIFRGLLEDPVMAAFMEMLAGKREPVEERVSRYAAFVSRLFAHTGDLAAYVRDRVLEDDNLYIRAYARGQGADAALEECLREELKVLQSVCRLTAEEVRASLGYDGYLPGWTNGEVDLSSAYEKRMREIGTKGYGLFSRYHMFTVKDGALAPVRWPDPIRLCDLIGYEAERQAVIDNTLALLAGRPAANTLLYGDAGTGKSSTVKAIVNTYRDRGLRLIEIAKNQFRDIPALIGELSGNPLKFILFIDDLSFKEQNDEFNALKAVLEGSVSHRAPNVAIYATSNRRHLVRESFSDRAGDDIHRNETMQELTSLSERFGLSVSFYGPDKELFQRILLGLKERFNVEMDDGQLLREAEEYAFMRGGRSPRVARQFLEYIASRDGAQS